MSNVTPYIIKIFIILISLCFLSGCKKNDILHDKAIDPVAIHILNGCIADKGVYILSIDETVLKRSQYYDQFQLGFFGNGVYFCEYLNNNDEIEKNQANTIKPFTGYKIIRPLGKNKFLLSVIYNTGGETDFHVNTEIKIEYIYNDLDKAFHRIITKIKDIRN